MARLFGITPAGYQAWLEDSAPGATTLALGLRAMALPDWPGVFAWLSTGDDDLAPSWLNDPPGSPLPRDATPRDPGPSGSRVATMSELRAQANRAAAEAAAPMVAQASSALQAAERETDDESRRLKIKDARTLIESVPAVLRTSVLSVLIAILFVGSAYQRKYSYQLQEAA